MLIRYIQQSGKVEVGREPGIFFRRGRVSRPPEFEDLYRAGREPVPYDALRLALHIPNLSVC